MNRKRKQNDYLREWRKRNRIMVDSLSSVVEDEPQDYMEASNESNNDSDGSGESKDRESEPRESEPGSASFDQGSYSESPISSDDSSADDFQLDEDGEEEEEEEEEEGIVSQLARWMLRNKITRTASDELLFILRQNGLMELPKCSRTILKTPREVLSEGKCGGTYAYLGIAKGIARKLSTTTFNGELIELVVNVDGMPLFKSNSTQVWPILCMFHKLSPFIVAIFVGDNKPNDHADFLSDFLCEYENLKENGFFYKEQLFQVKIIAFVCDTPARAFIKCVKGHSGYNACERCIVEGTYEESRVVFNEIHCESRDDDSFRDGMYIGTHQNENSILSDAGIKCISQFPLDYMHLVCLGVMKRLLLAWKNGSRQQKLSNAQIEMMSEKLKSFTGLFPSDFARQPRGLEHLKRWKATELRQFLLYTGCIVLRDVLSPEKYKHFLSFSLAVRILLDENREIRHNFADYAKDLLIYFVSSCKDLYGRSFTVYNVHNLVHLHEDSANFDTSLDDISSFPFENFLHVIKKFVRNSNNPLSQIVKRVSELENHSMKASAEKNLSTRIRNTDKDSWFLLHSGDFVQIKKVNIDSYECDLYTRRHFQNIFNEPCDSHMFNIVYLRNLELIKRRKCFSTNELSRKAVCLPFKEGVVVMTLLHSIVT